MAEKIKKSDQTKARLMQAMWELILEGDKIISVKTITEKANTAYGSFYRYYRNLDQVHKELIEFYLNSFCFHFCIFIRFLSSICSSRRGNRHFEDKEYPKRRQSLNLHTDIITWLFPMRIAYAFSNPLSQPKLLKVEANEGIARKERMQPAQ